MNVHRPPSGHAVPPHVRPECVVDYDVYRAYGADQTGDPHFGIYRLSQAVGHGIFWTPHNGGHWCIHDHELIFEAARRPDLFSSHAMTIPPMPEGHEPRFRRGLTLAMDALPIIWNVPSQREISCH